MSPVQVLNYSYWSLMLPSVVSGSEIVSLLRDIECGVSIGRGPASEIVESANWPSAYELKDEVTKVINADLAAGKLYGPFSTPPFSKYIVSPLGAFRKRDGIKVRVIHDLSFPKSSSVNSEIDPEDFSLKYSSVDCAVQACRAYTAPYLASVDLKDAYKAIGIDVNDWHLMGFKWAVQGSEQSYFFSKVLSFGLRSAPALFDRFAQVLELFMRHQGISSHIVRYVDDFLLISESAPVAAEHLSIMIDVSRKAGFTIQDSKVIHACRELEFLGIIIDLDHGLLKISDERMKEVRDILSYWQGQKVISKRRILKIVGKLAFAARVVRTGRAFLGRLISLAKSAKALNHRIRISAAAKLDLDWWQRCLESHNGTCFMDTDWSVGHVSHIFTDASDYGYGAVNGDEWLAVVYVGDQAFPRSLSINWRELHAATKALATWAPSLRGSRIMFHIDNTTACCVLNKLYSPVSQLMELVRSWCILVEEYSLVVSVVYISTKDNTMADALSRGDMDTFFGIHGGSARRVWPSGVAYFDDIV